MNLNISLQWEKDKINKNDLSKHYWKHLISGTFTNINIKYIPNNKNFKVFFCF